MSSADATPPFEAADRRAVLAVRPVLLESVLARLLTESGWLVSLAGDGAGGGSAGASAAVVSQDTVLDLRDVAVTVVLPDESGAGGQVVVRDPARAPLTAEQQALASLVGVPVDAS